MLRHHPAARGTFFLRILFRAAVPQVNRADGLGQIIIGVTMLLFQNVQSASVIIISRSISCFNKSASDFASLASARASSTSTAACPLGEAKPMPDRLE
jgi:hypothetical protein